MQPRSTPKMTIQGISVARPPRPGCPPRNTSPRQAITKSKIAKDSLPGKKLTTSCRDDFYEREFSKQASSKPPDNLTRSGTKFNAITICQASYAYKTSVGTQRLRYSSSQRPIADALHNTAKAAQPSKLQMAIHAPNAAAQEAGDAGSTPLRVEGKKVSLIAKVKWEKGATGRKVANSTEYRDNYKARPMPLVYQRARPPEGTPEGPMQIAKGQRFAKSTEYKDKYRVWPTPPVYQRPIPPEGSSEETMQIANGQTFPGSTEYKDTYKAWPTPPVYQRAIPPEGSSEGTMQIANGQTFPGSTEYKDTYKAWPTPAVYQRTLPPKGSPEEPMQTANGQTFAKSTEYKDKYKAWPTPPVYQRPIPPEGSSEGTMQIANGQTFPGSTEYKDTYKAWPTPPVYQRPLPPKGTSEGPVLLATGQTFAKSTEYKDKYRVWPTPPVNQRAIPPKGSPKRQCRLPLAKRSLTPQSTGIPTGHGPRHLSSSTFCLPTTPLQGQCSLSLHMHQGTSPGVTREVLASFSKISLHGRSTRPLNRADYTLKTPPPTPAKQRGRR